MVGGTVGMDRAELVARGAAKCVRALKNPWVRKATCFVDAGLVIKVSRRRKPRSNCRSEDTVLTFGLPNYEERVFLAKCRKAGEPLPVKKVQLKLYKEAP